MQNKQNTANWLTKSESYKSNLIARSRAALLSVYENVADVRVSQEGDQHVVSYAIRKWYADAMQKAGAML